MQILKETTEWESDFPIINKIYLLDLKDKIIAYTNSDNTIIQLKSPIKLDKRRRKFIKVNHAGLSKLILNYKSEDNNDNIINDNTRIFKVKSKDKEYTVLLKDNNYNCNCIGFGYRGKCKHSDAVAKKQQLS
jgi:hypothetical protein